MELTGVHALVTGATGGIGEAVAVALHRAGCSLTLTGRDPTRLAALAGRLDAVACRADLLVAEDVDALMTQVASGPRPRLAVLSAGIGHRAPAMDTDDTTIDDVVATNLTATLRLTRRLVPLLTPGAGRPSSRIVIIGSIAGALGVADESVYAATKAAQLIFADSLRSELDGIKIMIVLPGVVDTGFFARRGVPYDRRFPRPIPATRVADAILRGINRDKAEVVVPGWLRVPMIAQRVAPQLYRRLASRWG